jgi:hypothetical protein
MVTATLNRPFRSLFFPERHQIFLSQESCGEVGLGIEVDSDDTMPKLAEHPGKMINQGSFTHSPFVIEEC